MTFSPPENPSPFPLLVFLMMQQRALSLKRGGGLGGWPTGATPSVLDLSSGENVGTGHPVERRLGFGPMVIGEV